MSSISFSKEKLSIQKIGLVRFWVGILAGVLMAMSLSLFLGYLGESLRFLTLFQLTPEIRPADSFTFTFLLSALATSLGLSTTIQLWLGSRTVILWRVKQLRQAAVLNIHFLFWTVLWLGGKIGIIIYLLPQELDREIRVLGSNEVFYIFVVLPVFIFMYNWQTVHQLYRAYWWMLYSFFICIMVSLLISISLPINYQILNQYLIEVWSNDAGSAF